MVLNDGNNFAVTSRENLDFYSKWESCLLAGISAVLSADWDVWDMRQSHQADTRLVL